MATEVVRMWRPPGDGRVLLMAGRTDRYAIDPRGDYVFGLVQGRPMRSLRGRERRLVQPGQLVVWDPSAPHRGAAVDGRPWTSRLMIVGPAGLAQLASDPESDVLADITFPEPILSDPNLIAAFLRLHQTMEAPTTRLECDEQLAAWLHAVIQWSATPRRRRPTGGRDDRALRLAYGYLADRPERNIGLDELAAAAGIGKFRLVRLFRERTGLPPHAFQIAHRIRHAQRMLEAGETIAHTALATGFADQSHLHRHFRRNLGMTPRQYQTRLVRPARV